MSKRVLLGKIDSNNHGLLISKVGVDVVNGSGVIANKDLLVFDSREKGYAQVIARGTTTVTRTGSNAGTSTVTFSTVAIPNAVVITYPDDNITNSPYYEITSVSTTAVQFTVPSTYADFSAIYGTNFSYFTNFASGAPTPTSTTINYIVLRGHA